MLKVKGLKKTYRLKGRKIEAVKELSFDAQKGEVLCLIGPNGAGKTTAVKMLCGLVEPTMGEIRYDSIPATDRKRYLSKISAVLEGARNVYWRLTPEENMDLFSRLKGLSGENLKKKVEYYLEVMDLEKHRNTECRYLSRGNQQKVAIACALTSGAELLLLDEPTLGLDVEMAQRVMKIIQQEKNRDRTIIITTHNMELVEGIADRVAIFQNGKATFIPEISRLICEYAESDRKLSTAYINFLKGKTDEYNGVVVN